MGRSTPTSTVRRRFEVTVWSDVDPRRLNVDTTDGAVDLVEVSPTRPQPTPVSAGSLTAPVPGRVVAVSVAPGAAVTAGETLVVVVESMKLEHTLSAVEPGTVVEVAGVGDVVAAGQVVAVVAPG